MNLSAIDQYDHEQTIQRVRTFEAQNKPEKAREELLKYLARRERDIAFDKFYKSVKGVAKALKKINKLLSN